MLGLHTHTEYSLLDGLSRLDKLIAKAKELGENTICITDHGFMGAIIPAYKMCKAEGIKLIIGCEFYLGREERYHIIALAKNETGYKNLLKLHAISYNEEHFYYKPTINDMDLFVHKEGLIITSSCLKGEISQHLLKGDIDKANQVIGDYNMAFGDDFYIEIQPNSIPKQAEINRKLIELAKEHGIKTVVGIDSHYVNKEDAFAHEVLLAMQTGKKMTDESRFKFSVNDMYMHNDMEVIQGFMNQRLNYEDIMTAISNTNQIKNKCNVKIDLDTVYMPSFDNMSNEEERLELGKRMNVWFAENRSKLSDPMTYVNRIKEELQVINSKHYGGYFLIVADYIKAFESFKVDTYGLVTNLLVGPGRGSGVGSLVCYALGITKVDPIEYDLLFERFLNKDRLSIPDIDTDFCYEYREIGVKYMYGKYGLEHTAQISAFGTNQPKQTFRKVLSTFDYEMKVINKIARLIPDNADSIDDALDKAPELQFATANMQKELNVMRALEGIVTTQSKHAAGLVVCTQKPIYEVAPCHTTSDDRSLLVLSLDKKKCEDIGLVKHDFLGLKTLTVLRKVMARVKNKYNVDIDIWNLDKSDKKVYEFLRKGKLSGMN